MCRLKMARGSVAGQMDRPCMYVCVCAKQPHHDIEYLIIIQCCCSLSLVALTDYSSVANFSTKKQIVRHVLTFPNTTRSAAVEQPKN